MAIFSRILYPIALTDISPGIAPYVVDKERRMPLSTIFRSMPCSAPCTHRIS